MAPLPGLLVVASAAGDGAPVIAGLGSARELSAALGVGLPPGPLCVAAASGAPAVVMATQRPESCAEDELVLAVSVAGVVVLGVRLPDLARAQGSGLPEFMSAVEANLALRVSGAAPAIPARRLLVVAVRDFEEEEVAPEELEDAVRAMLDEAYTGLEKPAGYAGTDFDDVFDIEFCLLPNEKLCADQYAAAITNLGDRLRDTTREYADAGMTPEGLVALVDRIAGAAGDETSRDLPGEKELGATFACEAAMQRVLEKYRTTTRQWKATVDAGRIIRDFGKESGKLISGTMDVYSGDVAAFKTTRAFARKKDELKSDLLADAYVLYAKQILKLREVAYQVFRGKLARIRINDRVEKNVKGAVKDAEAYFIEKAESLRCTLSNWRFDNERHELVNHMREDATERLQLARLQGNYVPHIRAPIAFAFHTLLSSPFGRDSRYTHPHAEDMQQKFDPDKVKKAGLARARPHQRNFVFSMRGSDAIDSDGVLNNFEDIFADASSSSSK